MKLFVIYITNNAAGYDGVNQLCRTVSFALVPDESGSIAEINPFRYRGDYYDTEE